MKFANGFFPSAILFPVSILSFFPTTPLIARSADALFTSHGSYNTRGARAYTENTVLKCVPARGVLLRGLLINIRCTCNY